MDNDNNNISTSNGDDDDDDGDDDDSDKTGRAISYIKQTKYNNKLADDKK